VNYFKVVSLSGYKFKNHLRFNTCACTQACTHTHTHTHTHTQAYSYLVSKGHYNKVFSYLKNYRELGGAWQNEYIMLRN
jgi:hypothetical protein